MPRSPVSRSNTASTATSSPTRVALFGSSRQLAIGPTSAISMLVGTTLVGMAEGDPQRWIAIAGLTALFFATMSVLAWLLKLSSLVNFISETILLGFKAGAALTIGLTQLPKLFWRAWRRRTVLRACVDLAARLGDMNLAVLALGLAAIALLVAGEKLLPGRPVALFVVAASIVALSVTPLATLGFKLVGVLPAGLPHFTPPSLRARDVDGIVPLALACFLLAYIGGVSAARALAQRHGYEIDARQELLALGAADVAAALGQGYPVAGGLSQSTVNDKAGAKTPLALVFASITMALCLVFLTGMLANLPNVVLAAIVLVAVKGLINIPELRHVWKLSRMEFWVAMAAFGACCCSAHSRACCWPRSSRSCCLSAVQRSRTWRGSGECPAPTAIRTVRNPDNLQCPGALILRVESGLFYFNVDHVRAHARRYIAEVGDDLRVVIWDLSSSPYVDIAGARMLGEIQRELATRDVKLRLVQGRATVRDLVRAELGTSVGEVTRRISIDDAIKAEGLASCWHRPRQWHSGVLPGWRRYAPNARYRQAQVRAALTRRVKNWRRLAVIIARGEEREC